MGGVDEDLLAEDGAGACEVEVGVVGKVEDGGLVRGGGVLNAKGVGGEGVADVSGEGAGKALVAVRAGEAELDSVGELLRGPVVAVEADGAAVEGVGAVVEGEMVLLAVKGEGSLGNAVAVSADDGAHVGLGV